MTVTSSSEDGLGSKMVVVVDDDPAVRRSTCALLKRRGYSVCAFESGDALLAAGPPRDAFAILMDVRMPGRSGLETLQELKSTIRTPVILISGNADRAVAADGVRLGAAAILEKPYSMHVLFDALSALGAGATETEQDGKAS